MKLVITGASGFVGANLNEYLKVSYTIYPMIIRFLKHQSLDLDADVIIHLAGKAHDLKKVSIPSDYYEANFELTKQIFDAFLLSNSSIFIYMSTVKAVTDEVKGVLTEEFIPKPKTHYGISKQLAEQYLLSKEIPTNKKLYILRPCMIHGPGNKGNLNLLYNMVSKGLPWPLGGFKNQRSFLSIENLCFVIKELIENTNVPSGIYQVADDEPLSTNELIQLLGSSVSKKSMVLNISPSLIKNIAKISDHLRLPMNSERLQKLTQNYVVSNVKLLSAIGKELPLTSREGLLKTFKSFKY